MTWSAATTLQWLRMIEPDLGLPRRSAIEPHRPAVIFDAIDTSDGIRWSEPWPRPAS